jgi:hypothetical protein
MIILLIGLVFLATAGGGPELFDKELRKHVSEFVVDEERAVIVIDEMKRAQKDMDAQVKEIEDLVKRWQKIDRDHNSGRAELEPLLEESRAIRAAAQKAFTESIFEIRGQLTEQEWNEIYSSRKKDG